MITDFVLEKYSEQELELALLISDNKTGVSNAGVSGPRAGEEDGAVITSSTATSMAHKGHDSPSGSASPPGRTRWG